jgi:glycosyltransferase involved in cell wall biosynthesis
MRIVIDLTSLADNFTGIERFALNIAEKMVEADEDNTYIFIFKEEVPARLNHLCKRPNIRAIVLPRKNKLWFSQITLYRTLRRIEADCFLFLAFPAPFFLKKKGMVNAIHDLGCWDCPQFMPFKMVAYFRLMYRRAGKVSQYILTVSNFSKRRIEKILEVPSERVHVIYNGIDDGLKAAKERKADIEEVLEKYGISHGKPYLLSLATLEPRKNVEFLLKVYNEMVSEGIDMPELVMAGRIGWKIQKVIKNSISSGAGNRIVFTGFIAEEDLPAIYAHACCFVFPSKYEGFGIPPLEALYMGATVVLSDIAPFREIFRKYAVFFKRDDGEDLKRVLYEICFQAETTKKRHMEEVERKYSYMGEADKLKKILKLC